MEAVDRTSDVGVLLVTTLELFTVGSSLLYCDNKFRFEGECALRRYSSEINKSEKKSFMTREFLLRTPSDHHNLIGQLAEN
jgi:hypothetical protein